MINSLDIKKNKFFFELMWKSLITISIFYASFVSAGLLFASSGENDDLSNKPVDKAGVSLSKSSSKLADVLLKAEEERKDLLSSKLAFAEAFEGDADLKPGEKYLDLLNDLQICSKNGLFLVGRVLRCCKYFEKEINKLPISYEEKLKLRVRLDEVRNSAEEFGILLQKPGEVIKKDICEVLEINNKLDVIVLGAGFLDGSRIGMHWIIQKADKAVVRIVAVRPYASAAIVINGDIQKIDPGMEAKLTK